MKNKIFSNYLKAQIKFSLNHVFFYLVSIFSVLFVNINYFIKQQFFSGNGNSDLLLFFSVIPYICILIIPALCYKKNESAYDGFVPLNVTEKVFARFLEVFILYSLILLLFLPSCFIVNIFGDVDFGQVITGFLCLIFYGACVISFCILLNELFLSKIAAFLVSAVFLGIFHTAHLVSVYVSSNNFIANFSKQISFAWHFDAAGKGIFDTRDIIFFIAVTFIFIFSTILIVNQKKGKTYSKLNKTIFSMVYVLSILTVLNGNRWFLRIDLSQNKMFSITKYSSELLNKIDEPLKITYYKSQSLGRLYPQIRDVSDFLTAYSGKNKNISFMVKDPDKDSATINNLLDYGITSQQMRNIKATSTEYINVYSAIVLEYKGNIETIPFIMSAETLEYDLDSRITHLLTGKRKIVNLVLGNGMSFYEDYNYLVPWLNSQGIICNLLYPEDPAFNFQLENTEGVIVVIGDSFINIENAIAIENYILSGKGNAFFAVSPYSVNIEDDWSVSQNQYTNIVEILENWGITFNQEIAADISCSRITMYSQDESEDPFTQNNTYTQIINYPLWINLLPQINCKSGMTLFWPVSLELSENAKPYLVSSANGYGYEVDRNSPSRMIESNPFILQQEDTSTKEKATKILGAEIKGSIKGLFNYSENENAHIIAISDPLFVNTLMIGYNGGDYGDYRNFDFISNSLLRLNGDEELAELQNRSRKDKSLYKITEGIAFLKLQIISYFIMFILLPLLIILAGITIKITSKINFNRKIKRLENE